MPPADTDRSGDGRSTADSGDGRGTTDSGDGRDGTPPEERTDAPGPATVDVHVHLHGAVAGAFPLRVADLLFAGPELLVVEHEYVGSLVGLARGRVGAATERARERYVADGVAGLLDAAERTRRIPYERLRRVRVYEGRFVRPKVAVDVSDGPPHAVRVHAPVDVDALVDALRSLGERRDFAVESRAGAGIDLRNGVRRVLGRH